MMTRTSYSRPPEAPLLHAAILNEIIGSQAAQMVIDELGVAIGTHTGSKRDRNEDRIAVARIQAPNAETYTVALLCDGVGGSESGDQAAALAAASVIADLAQQQDRSTLKELAVALVRRADDLVRKELQGHGSTTLVMLLATASGHLVCANVGDSRAYSWDPSSSKMNQVTIDDTIENELKGLPGNPAALIKARGLEGRLSQAIGEKGRTADELRVQTYTKEYFRLGAVLGSDGMWRAAMDFETVMANATTPIDAVRRSIALANWVGGVDNASLIAIGDVEQLCDAQQVQAPANRRQMGIALWSSSAKVKLISGNWIDETKVFEAHSKHGKQKKNAKKKPPRKREDEPELKLGTVDFKNARPRIEVTTSEVPEKGE